MRNNVLFAVLSVASALIVSCAFAQQLSFPGFNNVMNGQLNNEIIPSGTVVGITGTQILPQKISGISGTTYLPEILSTGTNVYPAFENAIKTMATSTKGSPTITVTSTVGLAIGLPIDQSGAFGFIHGTVITNIVGMIVTASNNASATHLTPAAITFGSDRWSATSTFLTNSIGAQIGYFGGASRGPIPAWIYQYDPASSYPAISSIVSSNQAGGWRAASFYARMSDAVDGGQNAVETLINVCNVDIGRISPVGYNSWCQYEQGNLTSAAPGYHINEESDLWSSWATATADPYSYNPIGHATVKRYTSGDGQHAGAQNISSFIELINNGAAAETGILFGNASLDTAGGRIAPAIAMTPRHSLTWYSAANTRAWDIYSTGTSGSNSLILKPTEATLSTAFGINGGASTTTRVINFYSSGSQRWQWGVTSTVESGGNAGSNIALTAFSDTGLFLSTPIIVSRGTGTVSLSNLAGTGNRAVCVDPTGLLYAHAAGSC